MLCLKGSNIDNFTYCVPILTSSSIVAAGGPTLLLVLSPRNDTSMHRCIAILGPAIRVSYRDPRIAILKKRFIFIFYFFKYQSHMAFSSVLQFLLPTHSVDCAVHILLCHSRTLLVNSALFLPFTALIMPFFFSSTR